MRTACLVLLLAVTRVLAIDNGVGVYSPARGWRSWNLFHANVNQTLLIEIAEALAKTDGRPGGVSLSTQYDLVGLDDNWQDCGAGPNDTFHAADGTPLINKDRFPDMAGMVKQIHSLGVRAGFYMNNCICHEKIPNMGPQATRDLHGDAKTVISMGWDAVKNDGCGPEHDTALWAQLYNASGRPIQIENCHNGPTPTGVPDDWPLDKPLSQELCPYNFYRSSSDIQNNWDKIFYNLQSVLQYNGQGGKIGGTGPLVSRLGCWAYPDMLEVGLIVDDANYTKSRSHFGAWCVVSSPLTLSFDVRDDDTVNALWPIIMNEEALAVSGNWSGHPGKLVQQDPMDAGSLQDIKTQVWAKPQPNGAQAIFVVNNGAAGGADVDVDLTALGFSGQVAIRDIWNHKDLGKFSGKFSVQGLAQFDSVFVMATP